MDGSAGNGFEITPGTLELQLLAGAGAPNTDPAFGSAALLNGGPETLAPQAAIVEVTAKRDAVEEAANLNADNSVVVLGAEGDVAFGRLVSTRIIEVAEPDAEATGDTEPTLSSVEASAEFTPMPKVTVKQNVYFVDAREGNVRLVIKNCGLDENNRAVDCEKDASVHFQNGVLPEGTTREQALPRAIAEGLMPAGSTQEQLDQAGNDAALQAVIDGKEYLLIRAMNVEGASGQITDITLDSIRQIFAEQHGFTPTDAQLEKLELRLNIESAGWSSLEEGIELKHETTTTTTTTSTTTTPPTTVPPTSTSTTTSTTLVPRTSTTLVQPPVTEKPPVEETTTTTTTTIVTPSAPPETVATTAPGETPPFLAVAGGEAKPMGGGALAMILLGAAALGVRARRAMRRTV